jgi:hypothetical protein
MGELFSSVIFPVGFFMLEVFTRLRRGLIMWEFSMWEFNTTLSGSVENGQRSMRLPEEEAGYLPPPRI